MADSTQDAGDRKRWLKMADNWLRMIMPARRGNDGRFDAAERSHGTHQAKAGATH